jgi:mono/diheme cytochrome c family protein
MRTAWLVLTSLALFTFVAWIGFRFAPPPVDTQAPPPRAGAGTFGRRTIVLPHDEPEMPPGPGKAEFATHCVICHSPRYVTMQPRFPRKVWKAEVHKMVAVYQAPISEQEQARIVDYLAAALSAEGPNK